MRCCKKSARRVSDMRIIANGGCLSSGLIGDSRGICQPVNAPVNCIKCETEIVSHAYSDKCAKPWGDFKRGDRIVPLCLTCYCELTALKILKAEWSVPISKQENFAGDMIEKLLADSTVVQLASRLEVGRDVIRDWRANRTRPHRKNFEKIQAMLYEKEA